MKYFGEGLSEMHKELKQKLLKKDTFEEGKQLFLELHARLNRSAVSGTVENEVDILMGDLDRSEYEVMPTAKDETIAWVLWHIARIEDLTMNMLVAGNDQIFSPDWQKRMGVSVSDTGNAMSDDEIMDLSHNIDIRELTVYRDLVAGQTRKIVRKLQFEDVKRKVRSDDLKRIAASGGVTDQEESYELLDYWGQKDVAGLLLMPPTRHVIGHLNSCCKWKVVMRSKKKCYRT